jgi:centrosomal protein CEP164
LDSGISSDNLDLNATDATTNQAIFDKMDGLSKIKFLAPIEQPAGKLAPLKSMKRIGKFEVTHAMPAQIGLNISTLSEPTTPPYFTDDKEPPKMPTKGFTLSGTGSMFLKSNTQQIAADFGGERKKGILRDSSLTDVRYKNVDLKSVDNDSEDKKSVRFVLNEDGNKVKTQAKDDSSDDDDDSEDDEWDFHDDVAQNFVKEIKVTPMQKQAQIALLKSNATSDETIKRPLMKAMSSLGKTAPTSDMFSDKESIFEIFKKKENNQQSASVVKPLYDDSDSESPNDSIKHSPDSKDGKEPTITVDNLKQQEDLEKKQLQADMTTRLETFKNELLAKQSEEESQLRAEMQSNLERRKQEMQDANQTEIEMFELNMLKASNQEELEKLLDAEKEKFKQLLNDELETLKRQQDEQLALELDDHRRKFDELLEQKRKDIEDEHLKEMLAIRQCSEAKLAEIQQGLSAQNEEEIAKYQQKLKDEFELKRQEISESHRAAVDILQKNHNEMLEELARDLKLEEDIIKKEHTTNLAQLKTNMSHELEMERHRMRETGEDRLYEKIRCEKRLLEDKYR